MRLPALIVALLTLSAVPATAEPFWLMDWTRMSPAQGCQPKSSDMIAEYEAYMRKTYENEILIERHDMVDGRVDVIRFTAVGDLIGGRMTEVYVSDLGYCLATFYDYRTDDMLFRAGEPIEN
jgi:hypothetical protein